MDDDQELAAIRARRLAELQRQHGGPSNSSGGNSVDPNAAAAAAQQKAKEEEFRNSMLSQILSQEAGARLNTLKAVKPDKAKMVEDILIQNARMGRFSGRLAEEDLRKILEQINAQTSRQTKVNIQRRAIESDDDDDY